MAEGRFTLSQTRALDFFPSFDEAWTAAQTVIAGLRERNFSGTRPLATDVADEYGLRFRGAGWYLKLTIVTDSVAVISLHPLERPIRTNGGVVKP